MTRAVPEALRRGWAAELHRFRADPMVWWSLPVAVLCAAALAAALPPDLRDVPDAALTVVTQPLMESLMSGLLLLTAMLAAVPVATAHATGTLPRTLLFGRARVVFSCRAVTSVLASALFGALGVAALALTFAAMSGRALYTPQTAMIAVAMCITAGLWGFGCGVIVRHPIVVLFVVPASMLPATMLNDVVPAVARFLLPRAQLAMIDGASSGLDPVLGLLVTCAWLAALAVAVVATIRVRDRI